MADNRKPADWRDMLDQRVVRAMGHHTFAYKERNDRLRLSETAFYAFKPSDTVAEENVKRLLRELKKTVRKNDGVIE